MFTLSESRIIKRSPTEVFDTAADPLTQLKWDPSMLQSVEKLTPEPLGRGSRYRGIFKGMGTVEYVFEEFEPGKRFSHHTIMPMAEMISYGPIRSPGVNVMVMSRSVLA